MTETEMPSGISRRRFAAALFGSASLVAAAPTLVTSAQAAPLATAPPTVSASGAFLYDDTANRRLWAQDGNTRRQMASITKLMTAVVVLGQDNLDLDRNITVRQAYSDYVAEQGASTAELRAGDQLSIRQLLYATMLPSGCDAAMALADTFGTGSSIEARTTEFIGQMNRKAESLGLHDTHYDCFDGISPGGDNYTTPRDAVLLARVALSHEALRVIVETEETSQTATNGHTYTWYNTNQLLGSYDGAIGIKTGTGSVAGPCLLFAARRDDRTVIGVVLNSSSTEQRYLDAVEMLDYAFGVSPASRASRARTLRLRPLPPGAQRD